MSQRPKLWDSQRERKKKREREFSHESSNLKHGLANSQNKGLSEFQGGASRLWTGPFPPPEAEGQAGNSQSWKTRGNLNPRDGILHQTVSGLPFANQVVLGSWLVDTCQEGRSLRSVP